MTSAVKSFRTRVSGLSSWRSPLFTSIDPERNAPGPREDREGILFWSIDLIPGSVLARRIAVDQACVCPECRSPRSATETAGVARTQRSEIRENKAIVIVVLS
jgi:hypothetical protein